MTDEPSVPDTPGSDKDGLPEQDDQTTPCSHDDEQTTPHLPEKDALDSEAETCPDVAADQPTVPHTPPTASDKQASENILGYQLMGQIGRGGMGTVFKAWRLDDRFRKHVAVKVMRRGMDTDEMLERFQLERQVLGALNHPNIARLYDAGATEDGRPYFVMEYVEGVPIDEYCDDNNLSIPDRIRLFTKVCAAVHYAHQNLIVHRDLKPTNILVTPDGEPKLLDFGIAKLLNPEQLGMPALTRADQRIMTYEYASPEQVQGQQITTASDVYALGVILYELLTGHRPYQIVRRLHAEAVRVICEEEPARPSTAVTKAATHHTAHGEMQTITAAQIARRREAQISRLKKNLAGDLDNIILFALRKNAQQRYSTAQALADDLVRHLDGQTVTARAPTLGYRAGKFLRRNRVAVATGAAVFVALMVGVIAVSWAWQNTEDALARETLARTAAEQAEAAEHEARQLAEARYNQLRRMFTIEDELYDRIDRLPSATAARDVLGVAMLDAIEQLAGSFPNDDRLRRDLAMQYHRVGKLAAAGENAVGRGVEALRRASELFALIGDAHEDRIRNDIELSKALRLAGDRDGAVRVAIDTADRCAAFAGGADAFASLPILHAEALMQAGLVRMLQSRYSDAEPLLSAALGLASEAVEAEPGNAEAVASLAYAHEQFGFLYDFTDREDDELASFSRCLSLRERVVELDPDNDYARRRLVMAHERVGRALMDLGRHEEAQVQYELMQSLARDAIEADPLSGRAFSDLARSFENATDLARRSRQPVAAETYARAFVAHAEQAFERDPLNLGIRRMLGLARYKLGRSLADQKRHAEAVPEYRAALDVLTDASDRDTGDIELRKDIMRAAYRLGISARRSGDFPGARIGFDRAVAESRLVADAGAMNTGDRNLVTFALNNLAAMAHEQGHGDRMIEYAEVAEEILGSKPFLLARQHARGLALNGTYDEALDVLRDAMKPYISRGELSSSAQREFDELKRLEAEYEGHLEQQPGFDDPAP